MQDEHEQDEVSSQDGEGRGGQGWMRVSMQSPLGPVRIARRLPEAPRRENQDHRPGGEVSNWVIRRSPRLPPPPAMTAC